MRLAALLLLGLAACDPAQGTPIVLWHAVGEGSPADRYDVPAEEFERELELFERYGATPVTLAQLLDAREGKGKLPRRPVVITFDDGRACLYRAALPLLKKHHMVAEAFVITDFLGEDEAHRHVERDASGVHPYLLWSEAEEMARSGAFAIESHSASHRDMEHLSDDEQRRELRDSRQALRSRLGVPADFFAYPFGAFTTRSRDLAEEQGYRAAMSVQKGLGTRFGMLRTSIHRGYPGVVEETLRKAFGAPPGQP